jgi:hypothetical protein
MVLLHMGYDKDAISNICEIQVVRDDTLTYFGAHSEPNLQCSSLNSFSIVPGAIAIAILLLVVYCIERDLM